MEVAHIVEIILGVIIGGMGWFLSTIHKDVRQNTSDIGKNKGRLDNLSTRIEHEAEMRDTSYNNIMSILTEIKEEIRDLKKDKL